MSAIKLSVLFLICTLLGQANANDGVDYYESAFLNLYSEYQIAYESLNKQVEECSLRTEHDYDFGPVANQIPTGLSDQQLNSALFLLKKQHSDKCIGGAVGAYVSKASDLKYVIKIARNEKINIASSAKFKSILIKIKNTEELLFSVPDSYFKMLAQYQSISKDERHKLESIKELQSNYNILNLVEALQEQKKYEK